jgi:cobyrinic acid a,c-diamide synthase
LRIAVAAGAAFTFTYTDTLDALVAAGVEPVPFDPLRDEALPEAVDGLIAGGGFPEVYAADLAANRPMLDDVRRRVVGGLPTWAECGGLLWLCRTLDGQAMAGVVPADAEMTDRLTLGYRTATIVSPSPIGAPGSSVRGHEFHYSTVSPAGDALLFRSRFGERPDGFATPTLLATYLHHHPGGDPGAVAHFVASCRRTQKVGGAPSN